MRTSRRRLLQCAAAGAALGSPAGAGAAQSADREGLLAAFTERQTVRRYKSDPVPEEHLRQILDAARRAPTCMNQQPWKFLVIRSRAKIDAMKARTLDLLAKRIRERANDMTPAELEKQKASSTRFTEGYFTAPVYVAILVDSEAPCAGYALHHDGPIAAGYLMVAARAFGYGTAYLTDGIPDEVTREVLAIPARYQRICITPIGVPDVWPRQQEKRKFEEMMAYETLEGHPPLRRLPYNP